MTTCKFLNSFYLKFLLNLNFYNMKKNSKLLTIGAFLTLIGLFYGCEKKEYQEEKNLPNPENSSVFKADDQKLEMLYKIWSPSLEDYQLYCAPPPWKCLSMVIITPPPDKNDSSNMLAVYKSFIESISQGTLNDFFSEPEAKYLELFPYLGTKDGKSFLTYLQESQYEIVQKYNVEQGVNLFIVMPQGKTTEGDLIENSILTLQVKLL